MLRDLVVVADGVRAVSVVDFIQGKALFVSRVEKMKRGATCDKNESEEHVIPSLRLKRDSIRE
jgi:hypothetical protein